MNFVRKRLSALRRVCRRAGVDAVLLTDPRHVRYISGFTGEDSFLLVEPRRVTLLTDGRFAEQARIECPAVRAVVRTGPMRDAVREALRERPVRRLGIEGRSMTVARRTELARALKGVRLKALGGEVEALREVKDAAELKAIRKAVRVAEGAFRDLLAGGRKAFVGRRESEVAADLEYRMRQRGAERASFETIVAAGTHAALPHYRPGRTRIRAGQPVLIDWGAVVAGYSSDLTRVVFTGSMPAPVARIYDIVLCAQRAGVKAVRAGVTGGSVDAAARRVIDRAGYGERFGHGLGHGVGLDVHEGPRLGSKARGRLRAGMVVTVEPGIYLPGIGGVRIEDDVLVTGRGRKVLSALPKDLDDIVL